MSARVTRTGGSAGDGRTMSIFGREDTEGTRSVFARLTNLSFGQGEIEVGVLRDRLQLFLENVREVVEGAPERLGDFDLDSITLSAEVSAKGQINLLGSGGELAGKGGLTFTLKRSPASRNGAKS